jgi:ribose-phosphate pyrophosphokinase
MYSNLHVRIKHVRIKHNLKPQVLHDNGAKEVYACATHAVFSPPAVERLSSGVFQEVIVTNTIPVQQNFPQLTVLSVANLLGETIWRVHNSSSSQTLMF